MLKLSPVFFRAINWSNTKVSLRHGKRELINTIWGGLYGCDIVDLLHLGAAHLRGFARIIPVSYHTGRLAVAALAAGFIAHGA